MKHKISVKIIVLLFIIVVGSLTVSYFLNWKKYNSISPVLVAKDVYSWPEVGLTIKLPENFTAANMVATSGSTNSGTPVGIEITRHPTDGSYPTSSLNHSDFMYIEIFKLGGDLDKFIQEVNIGNKYRGFLYTDSKKEFVGSSQVGTSEAKWYIATAKSPTDTSKNYEVYFVNKNFGFIFRADYNWTKTEVEQILSWVSF